MDQLLCLKVALRGSSNSAAGVVSVVDFLSESWMALPMAARAKENWPVEIEERVSNSANSRTFKETCFSPR